MRTVALRRRRIGTGAAPHLPRSVHTVNSLILLDATVNGKPASLVPDTGRAAQHAVAKAARRVPHYHRRALIAEVSLLAASKTHDAITTRQLIDRADFPGEQGGAEEMTLALMEDGI